MERSALRNVLTFLLVLVLTIGIVGFLSMATAAKAETAPARYSQQVRESQAPTATELSAEVPDGGLSPFASIGAFALMLVVPAFGMLLYLRGKRRSNKNGRQESKQGQRYSPRADMTFRSSYAARSHF